MRRFNYRSTVRIFALTFIGFIVGFSFTMCLQTLNSLPSTADGCFNVGRISKKQHDHVYSGSNNGVELLLDNDFDETLHRKRETNVALPSLTSVKNGFIFIGVMTAKKFLHSRASVINQTWGQPLFPGQLSFFVGDNVHRDSFTDLPLVRLPTVDDTYPPQKKSFLMLKYMYDNLLDQFEWFVRADDDVYLRMDKLEVFLRSLNSSRPLYIGQAGLGTPEEYGMLSLGDDENYCMGGPSIVMSRETVKLVGPHVKECLKTLYTNHEDVELGRCVKRFAGVSCTWSYEVCTVTQFSFSIKYCINNKAIF